MSGESIYAMPKSVTALDKCYFYHTTEVPGYGLVKGDWDLRKNIDVYLGGVNFKGKRVLDVGAASGFLTFHMEKLGADVVSYDLSPEHLSPADVAPSRGNRGHFMTEYRAYMSSLNNAYWLCHKAYRSNAKMVHGTVYSIPEEIGLVDISIFGCVLLHLRDPFLALYNVLRSTRETVVIVEPLWKGRNRFVTWMLSKLAGSYMAFLPEYWKSEPQMTWWHIPPLTVRNLVAALGFEKIEMTHHVQKFQGAGYKLCTVVGQRTEPLMPAHDKHTSACPGLLRAQLSLNELPRTMRAGQEIAIQAVVQNTGDTIWLTAPREDGGYVTFGVKLYQGDGQLVSDALGRTRIKHDVSPRGETTIEASFRLPETLPSGEYLLNFDMVDEQIGWFEQFGSPTVTHHFSLAD